MDWFGLDGFCLIILVVSIFRNWRDQRLKRGESDLALFLTQGKSAVDITWHVLQFLVGGWFGAQCIAGGCLNSDHVNSVGLLGLIKKKQERNIMLCYFLLPLLLLWCFEKKKKPKECCL